MNEIIIKGAKENNLKNVSLRLPKNKFIVMTGLSGSGKSSLAFDTIYQEGQRRFIESLSSYARQFLGSFEKPDVESIEGLSPAISIDQRTTSKNPRSTVGTVTEIYDYLRLLFARIGTPYCPTHHEPITHQTVEQMVNKVLELPEGSRILICAPLASRQKGTFKKEFEELMKEGFVRASIDGTMQEITAGLELGKNNYHNIDVVIDRVIIRDNIRSRVTEALELACKKGNGMARILEDDKEIFFFSEKFACRECGYTILELEPRLFSFNSPLGACNECHGLGVKLEIAEELAIDFDLSINEGAIIPYKSQVEDNLLGNMVKQVCKHYGISITKPFRDIPRDKQEIVLYGTKEILDFKLTSTSGRNHDRKSGFEGVLTNLQRRHDQTTSEWIRVWIENYMTEKVCSTCHGARLNEKVLNIFVAKKNIVELCDMSIENLKGFFENLSLNKEEQLISRNITKEIQDRLSFLLNVGLEYLTLSRSSGSLSGGEAQRIRLATQIGSRLSGILYVLDEPSIGLHQRDNHKLIDTIKGMRDLGNTLIVVEHDEETMLEADYIVDVGPGAGIHGGEIIACGNAFDIMSNPRSITGKYLSKEWEIPVPKNRLKPERGYLEVWEGEANNLKKINCKFPLGLTTVVTGVSGSGKSSLVNEVLYKNIYVKIYKAKKVIPGKVKEIVNSDLIERIIDVSQNPIGRTPRSNPATYTGVFDDIRNIFAKTNDAKIRGYKEGRFSFNVKGGRCEACRGDGVKRISMNFLPDVYVPCEACGGVRYNKETLEIKYKGKSIADVLDMTIEDAVGFFQNFPKANTKLQTLNDVGLGYLKLGQSSTTLSGGEAQRIKLASELNSRISSKTLYIFDEPTTGLHTDDIKRLINVLSRLTKEGATVIIIEHNLDVIKVADYVIDLGPEGGEKGGTLMFAGTPEELMKDKKSYTGYYLKMHIKGGVK